MTQIHGFCDQAFAPLRDAFEANFAAGQEVGASMGVCIHGKPVADLWGGHADFARTRPWERNTIVTVQSATKIPLLVCMLMAIDRGVIALDEPVATYWPAFAAGGKAAVTVRDVLSHQGGVPGLDPAPPIDDWLDWETITTRIAAEPHWFGGERRIAYHAVTSGFILGEVMRRVDGRTPSRFFADEVGGPANIDLQIGVRERATLARVAEAGFLEPPPQLPPPGGELGLRALGSLPTGYARGRWEVLSAEFPSGNAYTNGRALARVGAILADGGVLDGKRYVSEAMVREAMTTQVEGEDYLFGQMRMGLKLSLHSDAFPLPSPTSAYWGGAGGALVVMDPKTSLSFGYAMNNFIMARHEQSPRLTRFWAALSEVLAGLEAAEPIA